MAKKVKGQKAAKRTTKDGSVEGTGTEEVLQRIVDKHNTRQTFVPSTKEDLKMYRKRARKRDAQKMNNKAARKEKARNEPRTPRDPQLIRQHLLDKTKMKVFRAEFFEELVTEIKNVDIKPPAYCNYLDREKADAKFMFEIQSAVSRLPWTVLSRLIAVAVNRPVATREYIEAFNFTVLLIVWALDVRNYLNGTKDSGAVKIKDREALDDWPVASRSRRSKSDTEDDEMANALARKNAAMKAKSKDDEDEDDEDEEEDEDEDGDEDEDEDEDEDDEDEDEDDEDEEEDEDEDEDEDGDEDEDEEDEDEKPKKGRAKAKAKSKGKAKRGKSKKDDDDEDEDDEDEDEDEDEKPRKSRFGKKSKAAKDDDEDEDDEEDDDKKSSRRGNKSKSSKETPVKKAKKTAGKNKKAGAKVEKTEKSVEKKAKGAAKIEDSTVVSFVKKRPGGGPKSDLVALIPKKGIKVKALLATAKEEGLNTAKVKKWLTLFVKRGFIKAA